MGETTAGRILTKTGVTVTEDHGMVTIVFNAGQIGNFTTAQITVDDITAVPGGHRLDGEVMIGVADELPIRLVTVAGSPIDRHIAKTKGKTFDALVLFALNPESLFDAAQRSHGIPVKVKAPLQLILFGEAKD